MTSTRSWIAATLTAAFLACVGGISTTYAQDKPKDEEIEKLLEKLDAAKKDNDKPSTEKPAAEKPADKDKQPGPDQPKTEPAKPSDKPKPAGDVAPKDKDIDDLLEGLGKTSEKPAEDDKKPGGGSGADDPMPPKSDKPRPEDLKDNEKILDKELEKLTGKKEAKKNQKKRDAEEENGPLGQVIKEMRDVEERLGQPDTGEGTRKKQTEIVKNLDQLIEQMKNAPSQQSALKMIRNGQKPGQQPGNPNGDQPGAMANNIPPQTQRKDPKQPPLPGGLDKSAWGHLPAQFRDEMSNVMNEHPLPGKLDLIRLYYLSLANKSTKGED